MLLGLAWRMHLASTLPTGIAKTGFVALLALVAGTAVQLQQSALWHWGFYASFVLLAPVFYAKAAIKNIANARALVGVVVAMLALGFGSTGLRSVVFAHTALNPALEGRDVTITGVVTDMPQRNEAGLRFRLKIESAVVDGLLVAVPTRIDVGWYGGVYATGTELVGLQRQPADVQAGVRWQMMLCLKAPHGSRNPHGFDYELAVGAGRAGYRLCARRPQ
jgi:competence protein ComEC